MNTPTMEVPVPTLQDLGLEDLHILLTERQELKEDIENAKTRIEYLDGEISSYLRARDADKVVWEDYLVIYRKGNAPKETLDRRILVDLGVDVTIINAATKLGKPGKPGITVRHISPTETERHDNGSGERDMASMEIPSVEDFS